LSWSTSYTWTRLSQPLEAKMFSAMLHSLRIVEEGETPRKLTNHHVSES
jgi:hypothetical protein